MRLNAESPVAPAGGDTVSQIREDKKIQEEATVRENIQAMAPYGRQAQMPMDGVTVTGEAVRRVSPESAEFLLEIVTSAPAAAQALRDNQMRTAQVVNAIGPLGVQPTEIQTVSFQVYNLYPPLRQVLTGFAGMQPQIGAAGFAPHAAGGAGQPEYQAYDVQFGSYQARNTLRVTVREAGRAGEVADAAARSGAVLLGGFCLRAVDEAGARRGALEAAGRDARSKAEALASAAGKQLGDTIAIAEEIVASNGTYMALRAAMPFAFGAGAPQTAGELEYYARVTARFGLA